MQLTPGARLGPYEVVALIGEGGMGEVWRARHTGLKRDDALKVLPDAFAADPERIARFLREAQVLASLNHPNIAHVYGLEEVDGSRALVMELVEGPSLADRIAQGPIPLDEAIPVVRQIAEALEAAHEQGIVHRDLKPANVKIRSDGTVKVLDFGLAKAMDPRAGGSLNASQSPTITTPAMTLAGTILGTAAYMSPEQARGKPVDKRADIWAFGCVLYEMLTARPAFDRETVSETIAAILERDPDWRALAPVGVPPYLRRLLRRCLVKDPKRRLRDIGDLRMELEEDATAAGAEAPVPVPQGRRPMVVVVVATLVVLAALATLAVWARFGIEPGWQNPLANARFTRYTDFEGAELDAAISPDGRFLVFLSNRTGPFEAWLSQVGSGEFVNISGGRIPNLFVDEVSNVGLSPDGHVWFRQNRTDDYGTRVADGTLQQPLIGGELRLLLDTGIEPAWSPRGDQLVYHDPGPGDPIFIAEPDGRNPRRVHAAEPGYHCHYLTWSPDARFVYFVGGIPPGEMDIWRVPASGGAAEQVTFHNGSVGHLAFIDDRTLIYRATAEDGSGPWLYALDVESGVTRRASLGVEQYLSVAAAAAGRRLVATVSIPESGLWAIPIADKMVDERAARRLSVPSVTAQGPRFGPDCLLYLSVREGRRALWRLQQGRATELWQPPEGGIMAPPAVSPDGRQLSIVVRTRNRNQLYLIDVNGTAVRPIAEALDVRDAPSWAPDGKWIALAVHDGLVKVPIDGGTPVRLADGLIRLPVWSPDGRFILYSEALQGQGYTVKAVSPDGAPLSIPPLWVRRGGDRYRLLPDSRRVVYLAGDYGRQDFWLLDLVSGARRQITSLEPGFLINGFDVSPDGRQVTFDRIRDNSDVVLIDLPPATSSPG